MVNQLSYAPTGERQQAGRAGMGWLHPRRPTSRRTREADLWIATSDAGEPVRHHLLDLALIEAIRADVRSHSIGIDYGEWTRLIADNILSTWPRVD
jgi:hypothetical protein